MDNPIVPHYTLLCEHPPATTMHGAEVDFFPYRRLLSAVVKRAVQDKNLKDEKSKHLVIDATRFLNSDIGSALLNEVLGRS